MDTPSHTVAIAKADSNATQDAFARWNAARAHLRVATDLCAYCFTAVSARMERPVDPDMLVTRYVSVSQLASLVRLALDHHESHHRFVDTIDPDSDSEIHKAAHAAIDELTLAGDAAAAAARYRSYGGLLDAVDILTLTVVFAAHLRNATIHQERARALEEADPRFWGIDFAGIARFDLPLVVLIAATIGVPSSLLLELRNVRVSEAIAAARSVLGLSPV